MIRGIHTYSVCMKANKSRIYLENLALIDAQFTPGTPVSVEYEAGSEIVLRASCEEEADIHIIARKRRGRVIPVIDFSKGVESLFQYRDKIRVVVKEGEIRISRVTSFSIIDEYGEKEMSSSLKFSVCEVPSGAGLAGYAFEATGLYEVTAAADMSESCMEAVRYNHPSSTLYHGNMFDLHQDDLAPADVFLFTGDCTSYSALGKRNYVSSESAPMTHHGLRIISARRFPVVIQENVPEYGRSIWYRHYREVMELLGYNVVDAVLNAWDFGTIATRPRFISVAVPKPFTFEFPEPKLNPGLRDKVRKFVAADLLDERKWLSISENRTLRYYFGEHRTVHSGRKGDGFSISDRAFVSLHDTKMPAFVAGYQSLKATGPYLLHPTDPDKISVFTPDEILAIQGFSSYRLPPWHSLATHYRLIGQAVCGRMFRSLAVSVATVLMKLRLSAKRRPAAVRAKMLNPKYEQLELAL